MDIAKHLTLKLGDDYTFNVVTTQEGRYIEVYMDYPITLVFKIKKEVDEYGNDIIAIRNTNDEFLQSILV